MNRLVLPALVAAGLLGVVLRPAQGQVDPQKLDELASKAAPTSVPTPTTTRGGSLGNPLGSDTTSIAAQVSLLTNDAINFLARVGRVKLADWCAFDGIGEIAPFDAPASVVSGGTTTAAAVQAYSYQSLGARFTFGKNVVSDLRAASEDATMSKCCIMRQSILASSLTQEEEDACRGASDRKCAFEKRLMHQPPGAKQMLETCEALGAPLDAPLACTAEDIMLSRVRRNQGGRVAIGVRLLRPSIAQDVIRGTGGAVEIEAEYAMPAGYVFVSGSGVALQSWTEASGQNSINHLASHEFRVNAGGLLRSNQFSGSFALSIANSSYTDTMSMTQAGTRADATIQLGWSLSSKVTGGFRVSVVKPVGVAFKDTNNYDVSYGVIPSIGGSF